MPYSVPGVAVVAPSPPHHQPHHQVHQVHTHHQPYMHTHSQHSQGRPGHRRSYTFADDPHAGPGAFASLGALPRRTRSSSSTPSTPSASTSNNGNGNGNGSTPRRAPQFHFRGDEDNDSSSSSDEPAAALAPHSHPDDDDGPPPPLRLRQPPPAKNLGLSPHSAVNNGAQFRLTPRGSPPRSPTRSPNLSPNSSAASLSVNARVPFPSGGSPLSPTFAGRYSPNGSQVNLTPPTPTSRPNLPGRTASHPVILLSNGKPLKSSLKSSSSAPHVHFPPSHHLRARSAPSTPSLTSSASNSSLSNASSPSTSPPGEQALLGAPWHALAANDAYGNGNGGEESPGTPKNVHFPAPDAGLETVLLFKTLCEAGERRNGRQEGVSGREEEAEGRWRYELRAPGVPRRVEAGSMVVVEGMRVVDSTTPSACLPANSALANGGHTEKLARGELLLTGTLLARNAPGAFEKHVFVRFTLDGWATTSENLSSPHTYILIPAWYPCAGVVEEGVRGSYVDSVASGVPFVNADKASSSSDGAGGGGGQEREREREATEEPGPGWDRFAFSIRLTDYAHARSMASATSNSSIRGEVGAGGVGRGLEGRSLELVGRFFAPWVGHGGGAPYGWCDTSSSTPPSHPGAVPSPSSNGIPAHHAVGTSATGRPWAGTGGGGSGEWWDNNGGANYRVGFGVVPVEEPTPTPAPTPTLTPTQTPALAVNVNVIPFPTSTTAGAADSPSTSTSTSAPSVPVSSPPASLSSNGAPLPSASPNDASGNANGNGNTNAAPTSIPPPPPPRTAHAQALAAKLGRLSLRNYAAPRSVSLPSAAVAPLAAAVGASGLGSAATSASSSATTKADVAGASNEGKEDGESKSKQEDKIEVEKKEGEKKTDSAPAPGQTSSGGVGLYWPWGRGSTTATTTTTTTTTAVTPANASAAAPAPAASASLRTLEAPAPAQAKVELQAPVRKVQVVKDEDVEVEQEEEEKEEEDGDDRSSVTSSESEDSFAAEERDGVAGRARRGESVGEETPPTSPLGARGVLPDVFGAFSGETDEDNTPTKEGGPTAKVLSPRSTPLPVSPPTMTPIGSPSIASPSTSTLSITPIASPSSSSSITPTASPSSTSPTPASPTQQQQPLASPLSPSAADASSSLYKAFVRQWCFAGGNGTGAGGGTGPTVVKSRERQEEELKLKKRRKEDEDENSGGRLATNEDENDHDMKGRRGRFAEKRRKENYGVRASVHFDATTPNQNQKHPDAPPARQEIWTFLLAPTPPIPSLIYLSFLFIPHMVFPCLCGIYTDTGRGSGSFILTAKYMGYDGSELRYRSGEGDWIGFRSELESEAISGGEGKVRRLSRKESRNENNGREAAGKKDAAWRWSPKSGKSVTAIEGGEADVVIKQRSRTVRITRATERSRGREWLRTRRIKKKLQGSTRLRLPDADAGTESLHMRRRSLGSVYRKHMRIHMGTRRKTSKKIRRIHASTGLERCEARERRKGTNQRDGKKERSYGPWDAPRSLSGGTTIVTIDSRICENAPEMTTNEQPRQGDARDGE
ncbi:hypothetical protein C8R43DRAFT_1108886 [Mycena crocata]|nr:hypothetical protein C8R43DRAFT_1108886 [Mycena crocata]